MYLKVQFIFNVHQIRPYTRFQHSNKAPITTQGLPELSSFRGSTLGTRAAEHKGCNWGMQIDW